MIANSHIEPTERLELPKVTLIAVTSVNVEATVQALENCLKQIDFAECKLFTSASVRLDNPEIQLVPIKQLDSAERYSQFVLSELFEYVGTSHCLIVQWDGYVLDARRWRPDFLEFDYIGATWPQFDDGYNVGNGGFSLRSRRLMEACRRDGFQISHPEDVAICRINRPFLELECGMVFADRAMAERFAFERTAPASPTFGFHGIFNMIPVLGIERFWEIYRTLEDRSTAAIDYWLLMRQLGSGARSWSRRARLTIDMLKRFLKR